MGKIDFKSGFVNLVGIPNSGKSTLINKLVGRKISIVSHKVQTTRFCIRGICNYHLSTKLKSQVIFVGQVTTYIFFKAIFHKSLLKKFIFGKPEILKINFVLNLKIIKSIKGKEVIK